MTKDIFGIYLSDKPTSGNTPIRIRKKISGSVSGRLTHSQAAPLLLYQKGHGQNQSLIPEAPLRKHAERTELFLAPLDRTEKSLGKKLDLVTQSVLMELWQQVSLF